MALLGSAALAMWWDMAADMRSEFENWHSHEHFRERLAIAGFLRATRWTSADGGEGVFQIYELASHAVLGSEAYLQRLNAPTPWSTRLMPHHRNMVRSQCHVLSSAGGHVARHLLTLRLSPQPQREDGLQSALQALMAGLPERAGCVGAHLLRHEAPKIGPTLEQKIRGGDRYADWVLLVCAYDMEILIALLRHELSDAALQKMGAQLATEAGFYNVSFSALSGELT